MTEAAAQRRLEEPLVALALALALLYALWIAGATPAAPHAVLADTFGRRRFPSLEWLESLAGLCQPAALALAFAPVWALRTRLAVLGAGVAAAVLFQIAIGRPSWWLYAYSFLSGAGLAAALFLGVEALRGAQRRLAAYLLAGVALLIAFGAVTKTYLIYSSVNAAPALDWSALKLDRAAFGFSPSAWAALALPRGSALRYALAIVYEVLPLVMFAVFALEARAPRRLPFGLLRGLLACGFAAALLYAITPVTGPAYALAAVFPDQLGPLLAQAPQWLATPAGQFAPRNAFPSFHLAWALLAVVLVWRLPLAVRAAFGAYALLIAAATLVLGEHYLIDLVGTFPALAAICALCIERVSWRSRARRHALVGGIVLTLAWALLLRPGPAQLATAWPLALSAWCALNVGAGLWWLRALLRAWREAA